ncbi:MAG: hypothetical protein E7112_09275, partial [Bacteroidales bacterium]|nr:hypothetical protein [Bacteroidales bacterium]
TGTVGEYTATLTGLEPNRKYSFRAYAINAEGTAYGDVMSFTTKVDVPVVSTPIISAVTSTSAKFSATVKSHGGETVSEVGFYYGTDADVDLETASKISLPYSEDTFSADISDLAVNTKYYVKSYTKNSAGTVYSGVESFSTDSSSPSVKTSGIADITPDSALLSGSVLNDNGARITERGFVWIQGEGVPTTDSHRLSVSGTTGDFTASLKDLEPNKKYSFRAYAVNSVGTSYGGIMTFTTGVAKASLSATGISDITSTSATLSSKVTSHGGDTVSEVGFYYSTDSAVDPDKSHKVNRTYTSDSFSISISELSINTKYYVKAYAVNSAGTVYSEIESFTTLASTPVVTTVGSSDVTSVSAVLSGTVVTDNGAAITERGFVWLKGSDAPTTSSNKVKVDGTTGDFTAALSDLDPNQKYSFRAYAINSKGTSYGDIMNFTTVAGLPTLSAMKVSDITTTSATFTCAVTGHSGDIVSEVGFYIGKEETVDLETALKISEAYTSDSFTLTATNLEVGTDYYVKAFTKNSVGESYSVIVSFKTVSTAPSVTTVGSSEITDSSVLLSGAVTDDNGEEVTERGFVWLKGTGTPTTSNSKLRSDGTTGEYSATLSALEPNQTYSFRSYAVNAKGTAYGETMTFMTEVALPEVVFVSCSDVTSSSAIVSGKVTSHGGETVSEVGFLYGTTSDLDSATSSKVTVTYTGDSFSLTLTSLTRATEYYVQPFAKNSAGTAYGEVTSFTTLPELPVVTTNAITDITDNSAVCGGVIVDDGGSDIIAKGVVWSRSKNPIIEKSLTTNSGFGMGSFNNNLMELLPGRTYYVRAYATNVMGTAYGDERQFTTTGEIQATHLEAANSFIISSSEVYFFKTVKGNSSESVGSVSSADILWESYGTAETPEVGSLVSSVSVQDDMIVFEVTEPYREGNAVIAAKDADGTILWSWHIWLTDQPQEQVYNNNAGTMMDRNLGATSATPGDVGALGLLYQWGRKDPFLGSSSIQLGSKSFAQSTITWPSSEISDSFIGTIEYTVSHPTTFILRNNLNNDWYYSKSSAMDNTRWQSDKTIYDPCPSGWRVPSGGPYGVWSQAVGSSSDYTINSDAINMGFNFSGDFGNFSTIWYPTSGEISPVNGSLSGVGSNGYYWSVTPLGFQAYYLYLYRAGDVGPSHSNNNRASGISVRCLQESE